MADEKVIEYIKENLEKGYPLSAIHKKLNLSGVPDFVINESAAIAQQKTSPSDKPAQPAQKIDISAKQNIQQKPKKPRKWLWIILIIIFLLIALGIGAYVLM